MIVMYVFKLTSHFSSWINLILNGLYLYNIT